MGVAEGVFGTEVCGEPCGAPDADPEAADPELLALANVGRPLVEPLVAAVVVVVAVIAVVVVVAVVDTAIELLEGTTDEMTADETAVDATDERPAVGAGAVVKIDETAVLAAIVDTAAGRAAGEVDEALLVEQPVNAIDPTMSAEMRKRARDVRCTTIMLPPTAMKNTAGRQPARSRLRADMRKCRHAATARRGHVLTGISVRP